MNTCMALALVVLWGVWSGQSLAQPGNRAAPRLQFRHLTNEDGLSVNLVWSMLQDRRGFLWFGTEDGLNRYDGYTFTVYEAIPFDSSSLVDDSAIALAEAPDGAIWIGTTSGLSRLDPYTNRFRHYRHDPRDSTSIPAGTVDALAVESSGTVWVGMDDSGLARLDPNTGHFHRFAHDPSDSTSLSSNVIRALHLDADGELWVGTTNGLNRLEPGGELPTDSFRRYLYDPRGPAPNDPLFADTSSLASRAGFIVALCDDPIDADIRWLWTGAGLVRLDSRTGETRIYPPPHAPRASVSDHGAIGSAVLPDPGAPGQFWIASREGLYHFDKRSGEFTDYPHDPERPTSIAEQHLRGLLVDRTGLVWVQTDTHGIEHFDPTGAAFALERFATAQGSGIRNVSVSSITQVASGTLWVVTSIGLMRIDGPMGTVPPVAQREGNDAAGPVRWVYADRAGALWLSRSRGVLDRVEPAEPAENGGDWSFERRVRFTPADGLARSAATAFYEDRTGTLWVGSFRGLSRLNERGKSFSRIRLGSATSSGADGPNVQALFEDAAGVLWVGTVTGLLRLDRSNGSVTSFRHDPRNVAGLSANNVQAIHERPREPGVLWIGLFGGGLNRLDTSTGTITHFSSADGLPNNTIYAILEDERGDLWMSTNNGISRFDPEQRTFSNYGIEDGIQSREFNIFSAYRSPTSGEFFFGGINGLNSFFPARITRNPHPPAVALTGIRVANKPLSVTADGPLRLPVGLAEEIRLGPSQKSVTFEFVALHFQNPAANRYAHRLVGFDDDWVDGGSDRTATYTNLEPGSYTFHVRAASADGVWNEEGARIRLVMLPVWWQTAWARLVGILALVGLVWGGTRRRMARVRAHNEELRTEVARQTVALSRQAEALNEANVRLRELDRRRRDFFANVSHEFRTPLTLILGPLDDLRMHLARENSDDTVREALWLSTTLDIARRNAHRLLQLINQLLDSAKLEDGVMQLDLVPGDLARLVREVGEGFVGLAERGNVTFHMVGVDDPVHAVFDDDAVEKVVSNLLSNAFKFTPPGGDVTLRLRVDTRDGRNVANIAVRDSGPGMLEETLAHVFERFYHADESGGVGTGIGLALAKELAELHGGTIEATSKVGAGSEFTLLLPLELAAGDGSAGGLPGGRAASAGRKEALAAADVLADPDLSAIFVQGDGLRFDADLVARPLVLVVDDNADIRAYIRRHLGRRYRIDEASDGAAALTKVREQVPDLVLTDVMMPGVDGLSLLRTLKADPETDFVPVVMLTARAAIEDRLEGLRAEADDYLTKPFEMTELDARVDNLIAGRQRLRVRLTREAALGRKAPTLLHAAPVVVASADAIFLERIRQAIEEHMGVSTFGVESLAEAVGVSRVHLFRRLRELCAEAPSALLMRVRLERAAALLAAGAGSVSEVAYGVGFRSVSHFSKAFRAHYGVTPSAYAEARRTP